MKYCEICLRSGCKVYTRFGRNFCEACKKFFLRNRTKKPEELTCRKRVGKNLSPSESQMLKAECSRCRLELCLNLYKETPPAEVTPRRRKPIIASVTSSDNAVSSTTSVSNYVKYYGNFDEQIEFPFGRIRISGPSKTTTEVAQLLLGGIPVSPTCLVSLSSERILRSVIQSAAVLAPIQNVKIDTNFLSENLSADKEEVITWNNALVSFRIFISYLVSFYRSLPEFHQLNASERINCLHRSVSAIAIAQNIVHIGPSKSRSAFYGFLNEFVDKWKSHFPHFEEMIALCEKLARTLQQSKFSFVEISLAFAKFIFRNDLSEDPNFCNSMSRARYNINCALEMYLLNAYQDDVFQAQAMSSWIDDIVSILDAIGREKMQALMVTLASRPHLECMTVNDWLPLYHMASNDPLI